MEKGLGNSLEISPKFEKLWRLPSLPDLDDQKNPQKEYGISSCWSHVLPWKEYQGGKIQLSHHTMCLLFLLFGAAKRKENRVTNPKILY